MNFLPKWPFHGILLSDAFSLGPGCSRALLTGLLSWQGEEEEGKELPP